MVSVKTYLVSGSAKLGNGDMKFKLYVRALKPKDAVEKVYELIGSRHKVKRYQIKIYKIEEITIDKASDNIKILSTIDKIIIY